MNTKKERTNFSHNIKTLRLYKRMSIADFAKLINVAAKRLSEVEKGRLLEKEYEIDSVLKEFTTITREQLLSSRFELSLSEFVFS